MSIKRCLQALIRFPEVVVVDNGSMDATLSIAGQFKNVRIYERQFCGFGPLKNQGAELASYDWIFCIDSDEVLNSDLASYVLNLNLNIRCVYQVLRKNFYDNLLIDGCSWGNDYVSRLYNRTVTKFNAEQVHESIQLSGLNLLKIASKHGFIYHFPYANTKQLMAKLERYAELYALNKFGTKAVSAWTIPWRAVAAFFKSYILKKGFCYGYEGLTLSSYNAMGVLVKYTKLYELSHHKNLACAIILKEGMLTDLAGLFQNIAKQDYLPSRVVFLVYFEAAGGHSQDLQTEIVQQLPIVADILSIQAMPDMLAADHGRQVQLQLSNYLSTYPELDGLILYANPARLADAKCTRNSLVDLRLGRSIDYGQIFTSPPG